MQTRVVAPITLIVVMTSVTIGIKVIAFGHLDIAFRLPQNMALWAVGILFSLAVAEPALLRASLAEEYKPSPETNEIRLRYDVVFPEQITRSPKYLLFFNVATGLWVLVVLLTEKAIAISTGTAAMAYATTAYFLAGAAVGLSVHSLLEADQ